MEKKKLVVEGKRAVEEWEKEAEKERERETGIRMGSRKQYNNIKVTVETLV
jgi:hypothetical protein